MNTTYEEHVENSENSKQKPPTKTIAYQPVVQPAKKYDVLSSNCRLFNAEMHGKIQVANADLTQNKWSKNVPPWACIYIYYILNIYIVYKYIYIYKYIYTYIYTYILASNDMIMIQWHSPSAWEPTGLRKCYEVLLSP